MKYNNLFIDKDHAKTDEAIPLLLFTAFHIMYILTLILHVSLASDIWLRKLYPLDIVIPNGYNKMWMY